MFGGHSHSDSGGGGQDVGSYDRHSPFSSLLLLLENSTLPGPLPNATDRDPSPVSASGGGGGEEAAAGARRRWGVLGLLMVIVCSIVGNLLVCLAVCWERRLQNMTNYFLMSLAIADLLVSVVVMPLGMIVELFGE